MNLFTCAMCVFICQNLHYLIVIWIVFAIEKNIPEAEYRRLTDNAMAKGKGTHTKQ